VSEDAKGGGGGERRKAAIKFCIERSQDFMVIVPEYKFS